MFLCVMGAKNATLFKFFELRVNVFIIYYMTLFIDINLYQMWKSFFIFAVRIANDLNNKIVVDPDS